MSQRSYILLYIKGSNPQASKRTTAAEVEIELKRHHQTQEKPGTRWEVLHVKPSYSCPYTSCHLSSFVTFPSVRLVKGVVVKISQCLLTRLTINIQRLLCTVIKLHADKEAIQSSSSLPLITYFNLSVNAKTLTEFSTYFKDAIQYYYCQFSPVFA